MRFKTFIISAVITGAVSVLIASSVIASDGEAQPKQERSNLKTLTVHLQGVFSAKISLIPFEGLKAINPIGETPEVKDGKAAKIKIPGDYLPGEFVLRLDYRAKETDTPYPAERVIYINKQNIELTVNPPYINNDEKTKFNAGERENTVYSAFMKENSIKRVGIDLLRQLLLSYDRPKSEFYAQLIKEFEQRRVEYNSWLDDQAKKYHELYVSHLFQFQHIPSMSLRAGGEAISKNVIASSFASLTPRNDEPLNALVKNYFEGIDFSDALIIRSRELPMFMDDYIRLYAMQARTQEQRDALFTQAGKVACEKASKGNPKVYGWMVDYFYAGYESLNITPGMLMLKEHINNPNCLTSKKQQIIQRLESIKKLIPGALAPDFTISDNQGKNFQFHKWQGKARYKLLLFWSVNCSSCEELIKGLKSWYNQPANKKKLDIVAVHLDQNEDEAQRWESAITSLSGWKHLQAKQGVNSPAARAYAILSTPSMFLIGSKNNIIVSVPGSLGQLMKDLVK